MAGVIGKATSGEVSVAAATAKTVLQLEAVANHRALLKSLFIGGKGIVVTDGPMKVDLLRQTTAGTMSAVTEEKNNDGDDESLQTVAQANATVEPAAGNIIETWEVHPQTGLYVFWPPGLEPVIKGGSRVGIRVTAPQAQTVVVTATWDE